MQESIMSSIKEDAETLKLNDNHSSNYFGQSIPQFFVGKPHAEVKSPS